MKILIANSSVIKSGKIYLEFVMFQQFITIKDMLYSPVNIYWESALNAASQTQRFASCWSTCTSEKSVVLHTRAV